LGAVVHLVRDMAYNNLLETSTMPQLLQLRPQPHYEGCQHAPSHGIGELGMTEI
jgi:hypothetical protein